MDANGYIAALRRDSVALAAAARRNLDAPVPGCPGWDVRELVRHTRRVHAFWYTVVKRRLQTRPQPPDVEMPDEGDDLIGSFEAGAERLAAVLEDANPDADVWSWSRQKNVGFVQRRMAQETSVHRWDAESALGGGAPIEPALAADGIDEFFAIHMTAVEGQGGLGATGETIHLHQTDGDGEWLLELTKSWVEVTHGHAKGDAAARGPASDLLLMLWRRVPVSAVRTFGDVAVLERLVGWADLT